jgi:hypothetical protein
MDRNSLTAALAALFALGAASEALKHQWLDAGLAAAVTVLALVVLIRRRSRKDA